MENNLENVMDEKEFIDIIDENGESKKVEVLHYFTLDSTGKDYVFYTDNVGDEKGNVLVYASGIVETEDKVELVGIEDQDVLKEITGVLTKLIQE